MQSKFLLLLFFFLSIWTIQAQTTVEGTVKDGESGETIIQCGILFFKNGVQVQTTVTDYDGNYSVQLDPGKYEVEARYVGFQPQRVTNVIVSAGKSNKVNITMTKGVELGGVVITARVVPLVEVDQTTQGARVTSEQIKNLPTRDLNAIAATAAGFSSVDNGAASIRGSRTAATVYYLDGIRYTGRSIPSSEIEQLQVVTGGIEAQYGDVTGGIISLTSKGPSNKISGGIEVETSQFLDSYGYNLFSANLSGPILKKKTEGKADRTIIGYRLAGQFNSRLDDDPPAIGRYRATEATINRLVNDPLIKSKEQILTSAQFLKQGSDVELIKYNPNEQTSAIDLTGKIDIRPSSNIDLTVSGTYADTKDRFTPGDSYIGGGSWRLLNWVNNPETFGQTYRANFRFRHRLGKITNLDAAPAEGEEAKKFSLIQNASYVLQLGFQNTKSRSNDFRHKDQFFNYGYVGQFDIEYMPIFDQDRIHLGFIPITQRFTPSTINPAWANFNKIPIPLTDAINLESYRAFNSKLNDSYDNVWSDIHTNVGSVYNRYLKNDDDIITLQATSGFDFLPFGSSKGRHNIQFGGMYEQRIDRAYTLAPYNLWETGRLLQNDLISGLDTSYFCELSPNGDSIFGGLYVPDDEAKFFYSIRKKIYGNNDDKYNHKYVSLDNFKPSDMSLDMFSARELTDRGTVSYRGFDYLGNKLGRNVKFEDYFKTDASGKRLGIVAPNTPIYAAGFIQDKFTFKDIIFRLGARVDYYDANTKIIKDPYSIYGIQSAKTFHELQKTTKPANIADDAKVYVTSDGGIGVKAYRNGDQWYFSNGNPANSSLLIFGENNLVYPKYITGADSLRTIRGKYFKVDESFEDYKPQINWMPRLAFSFPISEDANFFAHYDVLVQRPTSNSFVTALDYLYWDLTGRTPANNGNLKPAKTVDYEVGFQQKISNSSAIKISAYYKELRDDIQRTTISKVASVGTYDSYGNIDFGTVKGFNFTYDMRRTNNFELTAAYTLQFADGTGSDAESQRGLTQKGINIRNIFPFSYDERHRLTLSGDYRYGSGKTYTGPRIMGKNILQEAGLNVQVITASGRPYSPGTTIVRYDGSGYKGAINGARLPWNFNIDMKADKNISLTKADAKHPLSINVYFRIQNLLNTKNVIGVYRGSGGAEDDGYLATANGYNEIKSVRTIYGENAVKYFTDSYNWRLLNPNNFTQPRRIFVGAILEF